MKQQCAGYYNIASSPDEASRIHNNYFMYNSDGSIRQLERERVIIYCIGFLFPAEGPGEEDEPVRHSVTPNSSSEMGLTSLVTKMANYHLEQTTVLSSDVCSSIIANTKGFYFGYNLHNYAQVASAKEAASGIWGRNSFKESYY